MYSDHIMFSKNWWYKINNFLIILDFTYNDILIMKGNKKKNLHNSNFFYS
jgi:hypothetical protein